MLRSITFVFGILAAMSAAIARAQDSAFETRVYNVEFLTKPIVDGAAGPALGLAEGAGLGAGVAEEETQRSFMTGDDVSALIKNNVSEDSWEHVNARIEFSRGVLTVTNHRSVHEKIGEYLAYWRSFFGRTVAIEGIVVLIDSPLLDRIRAGGDANRPAILSPQQLKQILDAAAEGKAQVVKRMRATAYDRQRVSMQNTTSHSYIRDYDVQIATAAVKLDPVPDRYSVGVVLDVRPYLEPIENAVTLDVRGTVADLDGLEERKLKMQLDQWGGVEPGRDKDTHTRIVPSESKIHHPRIALHLVRTTVTARAKETILAGSNLRGGRSLVFLLTPSITVVDDKAAPEPRFEEQRLLRLFDISPLTRHLQSFAGPRLDDSTSGAGATVSGATFTMEEPDGVQLSGDDLAQLVRTRIAPDSWGNKRNLITLTAGEALLVRQKPEVLKEIDRVLQPMLALRAQTVTADCVLLGFRKGAKADWEKRVPGLAPGGYFVDGADHAKLLEEAAKGDAVRVVERAEVTCFPQQRAHVTRVHEETYISDHQPQISSFAGAFDPLIATLRTGFVFDVRPHFAAGKDQVAVELRSGYTTGELKGVEDATTGAPLLQLPSVSRFEWKTNVTCVRGRYTVAAMDSRKVGDEVEELVLLVGARSNALK